MATKHHKADDIGDKTAEAKLQKIIVGLVFLIPLVLNPWGFNGYSIIKTFVLYAGAVITFLLVLMQVPQRGYLFLPKHLLLLIALLVSFVISTVFSIHPKTSLFGEYTRFEGLLTWLAYLWMFYLGYRYFYNSQSRRLVDLAAITTAIPISLYAIAQVFGFSIGEQTTPWSYSNIGRSFSTLGNPSTLAAYLVLVAPLCAIGLAGNVLRWLRTARIIGLPILLLALALTLSAGGFIGLLCCIIVWLILLFIKTSRKKILGLVMGITLCLSVAVIGSVASSNFSQYENIAFAKRSTAESRLNLWTQTLNLIKERPAFGWGVDSVQIAFPNYLLNRARTGDFGLKSMGKDADFALKAAFTTDNAHNYILQYATTTGLFGILVVLWFFIFHLWHLLAYLKRNDYARSMPVLAIVASVIGYGTVLQFHFSTVAVTPLLFFLLGVGHRAVSPSISLSGCPPFRLSLKAKMLALAMCLIVLLTLAMPVASDVYVRRAVTSFSAGDISGGLKSYDVAILLHPWEEELPFMKARHITAYIDAAGDQSFAEAAITALDDAQMKNKTDLAVRFYEHRILEGSPQLMLGSPQRMTDEEFIYRELVLLKPSDPLSLIR